MNEYQMRYENGLVVVLRYGKFWGSYDTKGEAVRDILESMAESEEGES